MVSFNNVPEEDFSDDAFEDVFGQPDHVPLNEVEIQLAYEITFSVENNESVEEEEFLAFVDSAIKPSDNQVETPYGKNIGFYSICAPENFDIEQSSFNYYVHFTVDKEWCYCTHRNNRINFFCSLENVAITSSPYFMVGNTKINIENIKLSNITYPVEDDPEKDIDFEEF